MGLRVYSISDQDDAGPWIRREFPSLAYVVRPSTPNGEEYARVTDDGNPTLTSDRRVVLTVTERVKAP